MEYQIESNIPMPKRTRTAKYPFADMNVTDSFLVPIYEDEDASKVVRRMQAAKTTAASALTKLRGTKTSFTLAEVPEGVRVWRTA